MSKNKTVRSSYKTNNYGNIIGDLVELSKPKRIMEFGILDGYSLRHIVEAAPKDASIFAFDIFEDFPYNHAYYDPLKKEFGDIIKYGDFYKMDKEIDMCSVDFLHIDIANTGETYKHFFDSWILRLSPSGIAILEGGSKERDKYDWMVKFEKPAIRPVIEKFKEEYGKIYDVLVLQPFPSITIISYNCSGK